MKYLLAVLGAIVFYYLFGWIISDILLSGLYSDNDTIQAIVKRQILGYTIASTIWSIILYIIHDDNGCTDGMAKIFVFTLCAPWGMYVFFDKFPFTEGTIVLAWLITLLSMVIGGIIAAMTRK